MKGIARTLVGVRLSASVTLGDEIREGEWLTDTTVHSSTALRKTKSQPYACV